jgi:hypothetical protein
VTAGRRRPGAGPARPVRGLRLAATLVHAYPRSWRERYGGELLAWVEEGGLGPMAAFDLARGVLDARAHPELAEEGLIRMVSRLRGAVLGVLCGYAAFVVAGAAYQKLTEYDDFTEAASRHTALGASFRVVVVASLVALAAMVAAGAPIGLAVVRQALGGRRELRWPLALVGVSVVWFAGELALLAFQAHSSPGPNAHMAGGAGFYAWSSTTLAAVVLGVAAAATAVRRAELGLALLRFAAIGSMVVAGAMVVMLIAIVGWGFALRSADPALFNSHEGIRSGSTAGTWLAIVVVMAAASAVAVRSSARGLVRDPGATDPA